MTKTPGFRRVRSRCVWLACVVAGLLAGCASRGPGSATEAGPDTPSPSASVSDTAAVPWQAFQQQHRAAADLAEHRGQWSQVLWHLDVLLALSPTDTALQHRRASAQQAAQQATADRLQRARQARARGDGEAATRLYLEVLSVAPGDTEAADMLRALERERVKRQHLGQLSRNTLNRRMGAEPTTAGNNQVAAASGVADRNELEHASLLAGQGEVEEAIAVLRPLVTTRRADPAVRRLLADLYVRQAESLLPARQDAAVAALERALQADPTHARAATRLKELKAGTATQGTKATPAKPSRPASR